MLPSDDHLDSFSAASRLNVWFQVCTRLATTLASLAPLSPRTQTACWQAGWQEADRELTALWTVP